MEDFKLCPPQLNDSSTGSRVQPADEILKLNSEILIGQNCVLMPPIMPQKKARLCLEIALAWC